MTQTISVISTNNRGVDLLEAGRLKDALHVFKQGLEMAAKSFRPRHQTKSDSIEWSSKLLRQETLPMESSFVYARAMRMSKGEIVCKVTLGALTYNFALSCHLRLVEIGDKGYHQMIQSTMKIYQKAYALLQGSPLCLAVLNNMRQIHLSLNHKQASNDCRDQIVNLLDRFREYFALKNKGLLTDLLMNLLAHEEVSVAPAA